MLLWMTFVFENIPPTQKNCLTCGNLQFHPYTSDMKIKSPWSHQVKTRPARLCRSPWHPCQAPVGYIGKSPKWAYHAQELLNKTCVTTVVIPRHSILKWLKTLISKDLSKLLEHPPIFTYYILVPPCVSSKQPKTSLPMAWVKILSSPPRPLRPKASDFWPPKRPGNAWYLVSVDGSEIQEITGWWRIDPINYL